MAAVPIHALRLGLTTCLSMAVMLTLLIFTGVAARDAFDPRRIRRPAPTKRHL